MLYMFVCFLLFEKKYSTFGEKKKHQPTSVSKSLFVTHHILKKKKKEKVAHQSHFLYLFSGEVHLVVG